MSKITKGNSIIEQTSENAKSIKSLKNYEKTLYKERNNKGPIEDLISKRPKLVADIDLNKNGNKYTHTNNDKPFLLFDETFKSKRMIGYASNNQLLVLSHCDRWHMDGTFNAACVFYQLYILYGWYKGNHPLKISSL